MEREDSKKNAAGNEVMLTKEGRTIMGVYNVRLEWPRRTTPRNDLFQAVFFTFCARSSHTLRFHRHVTFQKAMWLAEKSHGGCGTPFWHNDQAVSPESEPCGNDIFLSWVVSAYVFCLHRLGPRLAYSVCRASISITRFFIKITNPCHPGATTASEASQIDFSALLQITQLLAQCFNSV